MNPLQIESAVASGLPLAASVQAPCASHAQLLHHFPLETKIKRLKFILQIETKVGSDQNHRPFVERERFAVNLSVILNYDFDQFLDKITCSLKCLKLIGTTHAKPSRKMHFD